MVVSPFDNDPDKSKLTAINLEFGWTPPGASPGSPQSEESSIGKLIIKIVNCSDLPSRDYGVSVDAYIQLSVLKERGRSLRRKTRHSFAELFTKPIRHSLNPTFNHTFFIDIPENDLKQIRLKLTAFDLDRHTKTTEIGNVSFLLRDVKGFMSTITAHPNNDNKIFSSYYLAQKQQEFGELLFGMSYLPTAQRMSFTVVKGMNLKFESVSPDLESFCPYIRILQLSSNGRIVKRKKTTVKRGVKDPVFNETLNFELSPAQLDSTIFILLVSQRRKSIELQDMDSSAAETHYETSSEGAQASNTFSPIHKHAKMGKDIGLGRISIGKNVRGTKERSQWISVVSTPRKVFSTWQTLR